MPTKTALIHAIRAAFGDNTYPGDDYLQGSFDGCEPAEAVAPFKGQTDWQALDPALLDGQAEALSFFSEAGLRFFLPAYLVADVREKLHTADPLFVLTHGFHDVTIEHQTGAGVFARKIGKTALINPRRYGAMTFFDYARWRLSVFSREEAQAIVAYLAYKRDADPHRLQYAEIEAALESFWRERANTAPTAEELKQHLIQEKAYLAAIGINSGGEGENQKSGDNLA